MSDAAGRAAVASADLLLAPLRIEPGSVARVIGTLPGELLAALARAGAHVLAERDPDHAAERAPALLLATTAALPPVASAWPAALDTASPDTVLVVVPSASDGQPVDPDRAAAMTVLRDTLAARGWTQQRSYRALPTADAARVIAAARLWASAEARTMLDTVGRGTLAGAALDHPAHPADAGPDAEEACETIVVAARTQTALDGVAQDGAMWLSPRAPIAGGVGPARMLVEDAQGWLLRPAVPRAPWRSGPLLVGAVSSRVPAGRNGEDVLVEDLLGWGVDAPRSVETLRAWWAAAAAAEGGGPEQERQLEIQPRTFAITPDGHWLHIPGDVQYRFPIPRPVLAFRAIVELLDRRISWSGWIPGLDGAVTLDDAATRLLRMLDLDVDSPAIHLYVELESDIRVRTGSPLDRAGERAALRSTLDTRLADRLASIPPARHLDAARALAARAGEIAVLQARLAESSRFAGETARMEGNLRAELDAAQAAAETSGAILSKARPAAVAASTLTRMSPGPAGLGAAEPGDAPTAVARAHGPAGSADDAPSGTRFRRPRPIAMLRDMVAELRARRRILASGLFDAAWYRARYRDVAASGIDPAIHYLRHGAAEGRDPGPRFDSARYVDLHPEAAEAGTNPLLHFLDHRTVGDGPSTGGTPAAEA